MNSPLRSWSPKGFDGNNGGTLNYNSELWKLLISNLNELQEVKEEHQNTMALLQRNEGVISSLRGELNRIKEGQNNHEKEICDLQRAAFRQMAEAAWVPEEETAFREELKDCNQKIWTWAKSHAIKSFDDGIEAHRDLLEYLSCAVRLKDGEFPKYFSQGKFATQTPALLVASAVSEEIYHRTICEPFLVFYASFQDSEQRPEGERSCNIMNTLDDVYNQLNKRNGSGANLWRAQLYRILFPRFPDMMQSEQPPCDEYIDKSLEKTIKCIVDIIIESKPLSHLLRETGDQGKTRTDELEKIVRQVVLLCTRLGTQRTKFKLEPSRRLLEDEFRADSDIMEAHRLHKLGYDDTRLDGSKIGIVVHPAICAWGDNDGENYDSSRALSRAVVWLEER